MPDISCSWLGDMAFSATVNGHELRIDADSEFGGKDSGPRPKPLVMAALAGCSGMDVVSILKKMREPITWFNMRVEADQSDEHPKTYTAMRIIYEFKAADGLKDENVRKAVDLSLERYCGVAALLKKAIPLSGEIAYL
ncbi:MAG TPA: OsmC family protein [Spirochaetia bacterium]|nr:OsmC family protein [Spirochaetaceae bacterium]HPE90069.1 OsmC family protein [Spirochaetales bacterium]HRW24914.1 OsmC family protein [Spirochaetia bacterium]